MNTKEDIVGVEFIENMLKSKSRQLQYLVCESYGLDFETSTELINSMKDADESKKTRKQKHIESAYKRMYNSRQA